MRRFVTAVLMLALGAACRDAALASSDRHADANVALCASAHSIPHVLLDLHHQRIDEQVALARLSHVRRTIAENATGRYARHLKDVAAAVRVFEIVEKSHGDTSDAYRDLRALRESLPPCPVPGALHRTSPPTGARSG